MKIFTTFITFEMLKVTFKLFLSVFLTCFTCFNKTKDGIVISNICFDDTGQDKTFVVISNDVVEDISVTCVGRKINGNKLLLDNMLM